MGFEILGGILDVEVIAVGRRIRGYARLTRRYGRGRWRKLRGFARVRFDDGTIVAAEIHWYEASGIGRRDFKLKRILRT